MSIILIIIPLFLGAKFLSFYCVTRSLYPTEPNKSRLYACLLVSLFFCAYIVHSFVLAYVYQLLPFRSFNEMPLFVYILAGPLLSAALISFVEFLFFACFWKIKALWPCFGWNVLTNLTLVGIYASAAPTLFDYFALGGIGLLYLVKNLL